MSHLHRHRRWTALTALAVATLGVAAIAYATIPGADGVIHSCYRNSGGALRVIDDAVTGCRSNETSLDWNAQGVPGPQGAQGPEGAQGPQGPEGAQGAPGTQLGSAAKIIVLRDDDAGNAAGWDPDESKTSFTIIEPGETDASFVSAAVNSGAEDSDGNEAICAADTRTPGPGFIHVKCTRGVNQNGTLVYVLITP